MRTTGSLSLLRPDPGDGAVRLIWFSTIGVMTIFAQIASRQAPTSQPWPRHVIDASSRGADGVRAADVNGDGIMDLVAGWEQGGLTRIYLGSRASGQPPAWRPITIGKSPDIED